MLNFCVDLRRRSYEPSSAQPGLNFFIRPRVFLFAVHYRLDGLVGPHFDKCSQFICVPIICSRRHFHEMIARHSVRFGARSAMVSVPPSGVDVRKLQRSHSEISRVQPLSDLPIRLSRRFTYPI